MRMSLFERSPPGATPPVNASNSMKITTPLYSGIKALKEQIAAPKRQRPYGTQLFFHAACR